MHFSANWHAYFGVDLNNVGWSGTVFAELISYVQPGPIKAGQPVTLIDDDPSEDVRMDGVFVRWVDRETGVAEIEPRP